MLSFGPWIMMDVLQAVHGFGEEALHRTGPQEGEELAKLS